MARDYKPGSTKVGWIGTGVMGTSMCGHLMAAGYESTVYNRTAARMAGLVERGARAATSPAEVAAASDVVFSIVGYPADVRAVTLGPDGTLAGAKPGAVLVDMTTSDPALAVEIHEAAKAKGIDSVDAPVSGGDVGAKEARLSIMIGGEPEVVESLRPLFDVMGKTVVHQGPAGAGQHTKMVNQILIASGMIGVCEALLYGYKAGLDLPTVLRSVGSGAAGSWSLNNLGPRMIAGNFDPGFYVEHFLKDMGIALAEAKRMNLALPGLALAEQLYRAVEAQGNGRKGDPRVDAGPGRPFLGRLESDGGAAMSATIIEGAGSMSNLESVTQPGPTPRRPRMLLVEDNEAGLRSLTRLLVAAGYEITSVKDGESAIAAMEQNPEFDYILTDLRLPDLDGREVIQAARRLLHSPRVGVMTGWDMSPDEPERLGIDWVFLKPFEVANLVASLRRNPPDDLAADV